MERSIVSISKGNYPGEWGYIWTWEVGWGPFSAMGLRETQVSRSGWLLARSKWISLALFFPLTDFGSKVFCHGLGEYVPLWVTEAKGGPVFIKLWILPDCSTLRSYIWKRNLIVWSATIWFLSTNKPDCRNVPGMQPVGAWAAFRLGPPLPSEPPFQGYPAPVSSWISCSQDPAWRLLLCLSLCSQSQFASCSFLVQTQPPDTTICSRWPGALLSLFFCDPPTPGGEERRQTLLSGCMPADPW